MDSLETPTLILAATVYGIAIVVGLAAIVEVRTTIDLTVDRGSRDQ